MSIVAYHTESLPGGTIELEVSVIAINRGFHATIDYDVNVWSVSSDGYRKLLPNILEALPQDMVLAAKLKLWEKLKP